MDDKKKEKDIHSARPGRELRGLEIRNSYDLDCQRTEKHHSCRCLSSQNHAVCSRGLERIAYWEKKCLEECKKYANDPVCRLERKNVFDELFWRYCLRRGQGPNEEDLEQVKKEMEKNDWVLNQLVELTKLGKPTIRKFYDPFERPSESFFLALCDGLELEKEDPEDAPELDMLTKTMGYNRTWASIGTDQVKKYLWDHLPRWDGITEDRLEYYLGDTQKVRDKLNGGIRLSDRNIHKFAVMATDPDNLEQIEEVFHFMGYEYLPHHPGDRFARFNAENYRSNVDEILFELDPELKDYSAQNYSDATDIYWKDLYLIIGKCDEKYGRQVDTQEGTTGKVVKKLGNDKNCIYLSRHFCMPKDTKEPE